MSMGLAAKPMLKVNTAIESPRDRMNAMAGRLIAPQVDLVLNNPSYARAKALREDPCFDAIPSVERKPLLSAWKDIKDERFVLLSEARRLDREAKRLFQKGIKIDKAAAALKRKRDAHNRSIDEWGRDRAQATPGRQKRRKSLEKKAGDLIRKIGGHNALVAQWRKEVAGLQ